MYFWVMKTTKITEKLDHIIPLVSDTMHVNMDIREKMLADCLCHGHFLGVMVNNNT